MVAPSGLNLYILLIFMDHVQIKNHNYQSQDEKQFKCFFIHTYTHQAQQQNIFHGKSEIHNVTTKFTKKRQILVLEK
jgi:hypothetical protein